MAAIIAQLVKQHPQERSDVKSQRVGQWAAGKFV
jgi:hypothetical protein